MEYTFKINAITAGCELILFKIMLQAVLSNWKCLTAEKMTAKLEWRGTISHTHTHTHTASHFEISKLRMFCFDFVYVFFTSPSKQMLVQAGT